MKGTIEDLFKLFRGEIPLKWLIFVILFRNIFANFYEGGGVGAYLFCVNFFIAKGGVAETFERFVKFGSFFEGFLKLLAGE